MEALAIRVGRSAASITSYELGRCRPPVGIAVALAEALEVQVTDLMRRAGGAG